MIVVCGKPFVGSSIHLVSNALGLDVVTLSAYNGVLLNRNPDPGIAFSRWCWTPHVAFRWSRFLPRTALLRDHYNALGFAGAPGLESKYSKAVIAFCSSNALSKERMRREEKSCARCGR